MKQKFAMIILITISMNCMSQNYSESNKAIGDIYFGMPKDTVDLKIENFDKKNSRKDETFDFLENKYIGNYEYSAINGEYYNDSLYLLRINGDFIEWKYFSTEVPKAIENISKVIKSKYGNPIKIYPLGKSYEYKDGYSYLIKQWIIKQKAVEVHLVVRGAYYEVMTIIKRLDIEKKIKLIEKQENDKKTNSAKDVF